jgi:hypothetical protein
MRGVKAAKTGRGLNPYRNERLKVLFDRGRENTPRGVAGPAPLRTGTSGDVDRSRPSPSARPRTGGYGRDSGFGRDSGSGFGRRRV